MGCKGSKHAMHGGGGARAPEARAYSGVVAAARHSVSLRSSTLGTLSLDRAAAVSFAGVGGGGDGARKSSGDGARAGKQQQHGGRRPASPVAVAMAMPPVKRLRRAPRTPTKTPLRDPEEINVWELMEGLDGDDGEDEEEEEEDGHSVERKVQSAPGSPEFDPDLLAVFRKAVDELSPDSPPRDDGGGAGGREIQVLVGVVRAQVSLFQQEIDAKLAKKAPAPAPRPSPPPESARRVVVYLTSLRGIRQTYEDCWATAAVLRGYGVRVDERDLSLHAGYKDELRAALGAIGAPVRGGSSLPQVFVDGWHLGGADDVRRMHESGELADALEAACDAAPPLAGGKGGGGVGLPADACGGCGGVRFVPCDACSGSCKVFVQDDEHGAGAFRRCPGCNENGLVRCPVCG